MAELISIYDSVVSVSGSGSRTLLASLPTELPLPEHVRLCVLDASRLDNPDQIALLDELAAQTELQTVFVLNKADLGGGPLRTLVACTLTLLNEHGFPNPELYLTSAEAACLFRSVAADAESAVEAELSAEELTVLGAYYSRFGPGENSLSAFAVTEQQPFRLGLMKPTPERLRLALVNTGVPALEARLRELSAQALARQPESVQPAEAQEAASAEPDAQEAPAQTEAASAPVEQAAEHVQSPEEAAALAAVREMAEHSDCAELMESYKAVQAGEMLQDYREQALDILHEAFLDREEKELQAMVKDVETKPLAELLRLRDQINASFYTVQIRTPYVALLSRRIEQVQRDGLERICAGIEQTTDSRALDKIRKELDSADCADDLKSEYYRRINTQQDKLDIDALDRVIAGAETMSVRELRAVATTLEANNWNPRFITAYRHRIDVLQEVAKYRDVQEGLSGLNDMERREIIALKDRIDDKALEPRFTVAAMAQIEERFYRMDMLRLLAINNEFDTLTFEGLDNLRKQIVRADVSQRAKSAYLKRVGERERALVIENTDSRMRLVSQQIGKFKLRAADFVLASASKGYEDELSKFWGGTGKEDARDYPVFIMKNGSEYAFNGTQFFYKTPEKGLEALPLKDIQQFRTMRQKLTLNLQIEKKDGFSLTEAKIGRNGAERTINFLNECLRRWNEPGIEKNQPANPIRTQRFDPSLYMQPVPSSYPNPEMALGILRDRLNAEKLNEGHLILDKEEQWGQRVQRLLQIFELQASTPLIWYNTSSILGSLKEAVGVGPDGIYQKEGKQPTVIIPVDTVYHIRRSGNKQVTIVTIRNKRHVLRIPGDMASPLEDYVKAIQLGRELKKTETDRL